MGCDVEWLIGSSTWDVMEGCGIVDWWLTVGCDIEWLIGGSLWDVM